MGCAIVSRRPVFDCLAALTVRISADASGIPGKELWSDNAATSDFGMYCAIVSLNDKPDSNLTVGTQGFEGHGLCPWTPLEAGPSDLHYCVYDPELPVVF